MRSLRQFAASHLHNRQRNSRYQSERMTDSSEL